MHQVILVLGDQLAEPHPLLREDHRNQSMVVMIEAREESTHVVSHKARIAVFLAAMRHFARRRREEGWTLRYVGGPGGEPASTLVDGLSAIVREVLPSVVRVLRPGEWRVEQSLRAAAAQWGVTLEVVEDPHFVVSESTIQSFARGRKSWRMETFYRSVRRQTGLLMEGTLPAGGVWNFDASNREPFGPEGPKGLREPLSFAHDDIVTEALADVERLYPTHPGELKAFSWPVTPQQAQAALDDFLAHRLPSFGRWQDAIWVGEPWLFHSRVSVALNLHLLDPLQVCRRVEERWRAGAVSIEAAEGFIRQVIGWREYVRALYLTFMPDMAEENALAAEEPLPAFYWNGEVPMLCLRDAVDQTLRHGYAHHIQRLMVTGLYALLLGVRPDEVHRWYLSVYVDAVEWVELPNTLGMALHADGGRMASKPYIATGKYLQRMSNACASCALDPSVAVGENACPFTTLYWDFLQRHQERFRRHPRMALQVRNLERKPVDELRAIRAQAEAIRASGGVPPSVGQVGPKQLGLELS